MTPKDLVDGIAHFGNAIVATERAQWNSSGDLKGNLSLPFMKGTLADAIDASSVLNQFIAQYTANPARCQAPDSDSAQLGQPLFASCRS